ncbi:phosphate acyltransferase PlsX [Aestuariirhabdus litorea]|uniref:Phosphate acyltransferase n=1 Tax=Aestuariirhabdus litorea TaxID=2528527 RepID=A0A3P3VPK4_9GAMM|nr:phosphate acyltransferase PlsX [Aestuariirhabdus litorea]RRJ84701.1 phosphate acyltransferase PlsX [Aestuariirhabdus litorea]RWW97926.1 phosphate acyltransferase PlsX [Endozoicomonadaceae bacterium GTF-13]
MATTVALDAMSGDLGPREAVLAAVSSLQEHPELSLILVGDTPILRQHLSDCPPYDRSRLSIAHAADVINMDDKPSVALRSKRASSMRIALEQVSLGAAQACISCGNTGALMALGRFLLKTFPGIDRPAIITRLPTESGFTYMLDLGANVDCTGDHLYQFAAMGAAMVEALHQLPSPRIRLLNVGSEEMKGNEQVRLAARLIKHNEALNYQGFIEGSELFSGVCELIVCDGFVGNIALKTSEGVGRMLQHNLQQIATSSWYTRLASLLLKPYIEKLLHSGDPDRYNGASLLGLQGIVIKSHGQSDSKRIQQAIRQAMAEAKNNVPTLLNEHLEQLLI